MKVTERLWRTADNRLVRDGDEAAQRLAYTPGDEVAPRDESLVPGDEPEQAEEPAEPKLRAKAAVKPADKQAAKPDDK